jgi:AraC-like DNA-binding protein
MMRSFQPTPLDTVRAPLALSSVYTQSSPRDCGRIVSCLPVKLHSRVAAAFPRTIPQRIVEQRQLHRIIEEAGCDVLLLDVGGTKEDFVTRALHTCSLSLCTVVAYSELTSLCAHRLLGAATLLGDIIAFGMDDGPAELRKRLTTTFHPSAATVCMRRLISQFCVLPGEALSVALALLLGARIPKTVGELAIASGMPRRSLDRWIGRAGLTSAVALLVGARVIRLRTLSDRGDLPVSNATSECYKSYETARDHFTRVFGCSPSRALHRMSTDAFVDRVVAFVAQGDMAVAKKPTSMA